MSRTAIRRAHTAWAKELEPLGLAPGDEMPEDAPARHLAKVTCTTCSHPSEIMVPDDPDVEVGWKCNCHALGEGCSCDAPNLVEGHAGEPGEGTLNPAASAVSDEDLMEAVTRRGLVQNLKIEGGTAPTGSSAGDNA